MVTNKIKKILIIDDDVEITSELAELLSKHNFDVLVAGNATETQDFLRTERIDLILLDLTLPRMSGLDLCREIRKISNVPILIISASGQLVDKVAGLELGADDYIQKPFEFRELLARIRAFLRRSENHVISTPESQGNNLICEELNLDLKKGLATYNGQFLDLTRMEFSVLSFLMQNHSKPLTREELMAEIRGQELSHGDRTVDVVISKLRSKLNDDAKNSRFLKTLWGSGYSFVGKVKSL